MEKVAGLFCIYFQIISQKDTCGRIIYWDANLPFVLFSCPIPRMLFCFLSLSFCSAGSGQYNCLLFFKGKFFEGLMLCGLKRGERQEPRRESLLQKPQREIYLGRRAPWSSGDQDPVPLCCSIVTSWGRGLTLVWNGFVVRWVPDPLC